MTPTPVTPESLGFVDIAPLPLFPLIPSTALWLVLGLLILGGVLLARRERERRRDPRRALDIVHRALERITTEAAVRDDISAASLAVKRLLAAWGFGDLTPFTEAELRRSAESAEPAALGETLLNLAALDALTYQPHAIVGAAPLGRTLRVSVDALAEIRSHASREARG